MRFPADVVKATVFVGLEANGRFIPRGSGFFATVPYQGYFFPFVVTADHVVELIQGDFIWIRINRRSGGCSTIKLEKSRKISHRIHQNDIAMFSVDYDESPFDTKALLLDRNEYNKQRDGLWLEDIGDEVATVGLYSTHYGEEKNVPVVRVGNISLMPGEKVLSHRGYVKAYLIEIKSIAGLSGSPVYITLLAFTVRDGLLRTLKNKKDAAARPLGMLTGYHMITSSEDQIQVPEYQGDDVGHHEKKS